jgi:hypothetical protein
MYKKTLSQYVNKMVGVHTRSKLLIITEGSISYNGQSSKYRIPLRLEQKIQIK